MVVEVKKVAKSYGKKNGSRVLRDVSLHIEREACVALLGVSGVGKSTLGRIVVGLERADQGRIFIQGERILVGKNKRFRNKVQIVFQDPYSAFNPRLTMAQSLAEPLLIERVKKRERYERINAILEDVQLDQELLDRYPKQLSGGQLQRAAIARALICRPLFIVFDEVVSSLDVVQQHHILTLLHRLKETYDLSYLFITHDFQAAKYIADRILVLHAGEVVDQVEKNGNGSWQHFKHPQAIRLQEAVWS
ncbi:nickel transport system ATP-binding protein [Geomicrobium halophilum]|uniref:Nickel transport system ATP-binding protein n=1 Tax=Geomicrobium halophilum TaxID=549000 RepID=A0A841PNC6_9BACL|nr:dipeptide/oligopeptide/nickel ABC transporter ATP-binding protein [Geomicrobium halophilum]MBB6448706.1 nickel transport system ATP-binding protein [Geomicrobium halophilum]